MEIDSIVFEFIQFSDEDHICMYKIYRLNLFRAIRDRTFLNPFK